MTFNVTPSTALLSEAEDNSSTVNATDVTSQEEDTKTVLTDHEPSVMSVSSSTASHTRSYITLKPTEQVIVLSYYALGRGFWVYSEIEIAGMIKIILPFRA